ncbi:MAG: hypothetical protein HFG22_09115 [Lachnospiraceae bacterium]|nr:hypothetical protein [Lachnospiraceae bacterium]
MKRQVYDRILEKAVRDGCLFISASDGSSAVLARAFGEGLPRLIGRYNTICILSIRKDRTRSNTFPDDQNKDPICKRQADRYNLMDRNENTDLPEQRF